MDFLLQILLLLTIIIFSAKIAGAIANKFGQPAVFGEILIGLILGPTFLNILNWNLFSTSHTDVNLHLCETINILAEIGVILLMFVAGLETDLDKMKKVGRVAFASAAGGAILPMLAGIIICRCFGISWAESIFVGTILTATSVGITAQTLIELKAVSSKEGTAILGAAIIDDVLGIILLSFVVAFTTETGKGDIQDIIYLILKMGLFFGLGIFLGNKFLRKLTFYASKIPATESILAFSLIICFLYSFFAEYFGKVAAITGSYIAGALFTKTGFKEKIEHGFHPLTYSMFVPIFFINIGLKVDGRELGENILFLILIVIFAILTKVIGCWIGARLFGFNNISSLRVGIGMISRGEVGLIIASYGLSHSIISRDVFSTTVIMVLVSTMITPILLRYVFPKSEITRGDRIIAHD